jgi:hypothetical protein
VSEQLLWIVCFTVLVAMLWGAYSDWRGDRRSRGRALLLLLAVLVFAVLLATVWATLQIAEDT